MEIRLMEMQRLSIPEHFKKFNNELTPIEEKFLNILTDFEISSMVKAVYPQFWIKTINGYRRIDFVLVLEDSYERRRGLFIEIDGNHHKETKQKYKDLEREFEIKSANFPIMRFMGQDVFYRPEWVANQVEAQIETLKG